MAQPAKGLGKGLLALMGESVTLVETTALVRDQPITHLPISQLTAGKYQPRRHFDAEALAELADSIEKHGLMQPIVVRALSSTTYEIIAGERRFRAAQLAKLTKVPVIVRDVDDAEALELALIENIQRADLNPLEEAAGYQRLMDEFGYTQEKLAPVVGKSRSHIANLLRLLKLPASIKARIDSGQLTMGHARALLMAKDPETLAQQIVDIGLSVRQAEDLAKGATSLEQIANGISATPVPSKHTGTEQTRASKGKSEDVLQLEAMLAENLGLRVSITTRSGQAGDVIISYDSLMQLDEVLRRLGG